MPYITFKPKELNTALTLLTKLDNYYFPFVVIRLGKESVYLEGVDHAVQVQGCTVDNPDKWGFMLMQINPLMELAESLSDVHIWTDDLLEVHWKTATTLGVTLLHLDGKHFSLYTANKFQTDQTPIWFMDLNDKSEIDKLVKFTRTDDYPGYKQVRVELKDPKKAGYLVTCDNYHGHQSHFPHIALNDYQWSFDFVARILPIIFKNQKRVYLGKIDKIVCFETSSGEIRALESSDYRVPNVESKFLEVQEDICFEVDGQALKKALLELEKQAKQKQDNASYVRFRVVTTEPHEPKFEQHLLLTACTIKEQGITQTLPLKSLSLTVPLDLKMNRVYLADAIGSAKVVRLTGSNQGFWQVVDTERTNQLSVIAPCR